MSITSNLQPICVHLSAASDLMAERELTKALNPYPT
jgi:hypothetical protein